MRMEYIPVAVRTQILFFCVSDLANVDPMYQYSLEWFLGIFLSGITNSERAGSPGTHGLGDTDAGLPPGTDGTLMDVSPLWAHTRRHACSLAHMLTSDSHYRRTPPALPPPRALFPGSANAPRGCPGRPVYSGSWAGPGQHVAALTSALQTT